MRHVEPRHFTPDAGVPGGGLPGDREARIAARRAFVGLKGAFLDALVDMRGAEATWLRGQVLSAEESVDLWLLRASMFETLAGLERRPRRQALRRALESMYPDTQPPSAFSPL
ncbi:MAG: hypothetical protein KGL78_05725 [Burkholderiales bacterium]|nr:hypothetical protein [Burkholderiales bacterium]